MEDLQALSFGFSFPLAARNKLTNASDQTPNHSLPRRRLTTPPFSYPIHFLYHHQSVESTIWRRSLCRTVLDCPGLFLTAMMRPISLENSAISSLSRGTPRSMLGLAKGALLDPGWAACLSGVSDHASARPGRLAALPGAAMPPDPPTKHHPSCRLKRHPGGCC